MRCCSFLSRMCMWSFGSSKQFRAMCIRIWGISRESHVWWNHISTRSACHKRSFGWNAIDYHVLKLHVDKNVLYENNKHKSFIVLHNMYMSCMHKTRQSKWESSIFYGAAHHSYLSKKFNGSYSFNWRDSIWIKFHVIWWGIWTKQIKMEKHWISL